MMGIVMGMPQWDAKALEPAILANLNDIATEALAKAKSPQA